MSAGERSGEHDATIEIGDPREADPVEQRQILADVERGLFGARALPVRFGRFVMLERRGRGGGGSVWAAYDPELDRKVAIKFLHSDARASSAGDARARLLREAQALAQLSHPNIVAIHDVGTYEPESDGVLGGRGAFGGAGVYIVMELVEGHDLGAWLTVHERRWRDVLAIFREAGRGLAAAHGAGILHRDFKPANVVVGHDGRVRVVDFGLARTFRSLSGNPSVDSETTRRSAAFAGERAEDADDEDTRSLDSEIRPRELELPLTRDGVLLGTPAYMAPEQHRGETTDERSDTYAFCVALFEGLHGAPPFQGRDLAELARAKARGTVTVPDHGRVVPRWLHEVVCRGLAPDPAQRYADMRPLLAALDRDPARQRRRIASLGLGGIAVASLAVFASRTAQSPASACAEDHASALVGVWDRAVRDETATTFAATSVAYAPQVLDTVTRELDAYAARWLELRVETCRIMLAGSPSGATAASRSVVCLERRRARLDGLTRSLRRAQPGAVSGAVRAVAALPALESCEPGAVEPREERGRSDHDEILAVETMLAEISAQLYGAEHDRAGTMIAEALARARSIPDDPTLARAYAVLAQVELGRGELAAAETAMRDSLLEAERIGDDEQAIEATIELVLLVGDLLARPQEALHLAAQARARLESTELGAGARIRLGYYLGRALERHDRYDEALRELGDALAQAEQVLGPVHTIVADIVNHIGVVHDRQGRYAEALAQYQRALAIEEEILGSAHPKIATTMCNVGIMMRRLGEYERAVAELSRCVRQMQGSVGADHPSLAWARDSLGWALGAVDRQEDRLIEHMAALRIRERALGPEHPDVATSLVNIADAHNARGHPADGVVHAERAVAVAERADSARALVFALLVLGETYTKMEQPRFAIPPLERALQLTERSESEPHPSRAAVLYDLGVAWLATGESARGIDFLTRAVEFSVQHDPDPGKLAARRFELAKALAPSERARARSLAEQARAGFVAVNWTDDLAAVDEWLRAHPPASTARAR